MWGTNGGLSTVTPLLSSVSQSFASVRCSRRDVAVTYVCLCQEKLVAVLLQLQDVLGCDCSCSAHVQLFLSRPFCSTAVGCLARLTFQSEIIYLKILVLS